LSLVELVVTERAKTARQQYRADCLSRRLGILQRQTVSVTLDGIKARRSNGRFYLLRNGGVSEIDAYLGG
jgi:hypothetical protein